MINKLFLFLLFLSSGENCLGQKDTGEKEITVYIIEAGMHTSIALPVNTTFVDWDTIINFKELNGSKEMFEYLGFGWGEKKYYLSLARKGRANIGIGARALFWPTEPVMKVDGYIGLNEGPKVIAVTINEKQFFALYEHIICSFKFNEHGHMEKLSTGLHGFDAFYSSPGKYTIFYNSNHWTARGLKKANIKAPLAPITSGPIMRILRNNYVPK
jgi:uncharacterized protein (TIGR02117 family)